MKKIPALLLALVLCMALASCGGGTPTGSVEGYLNAIKEGDLKKAGSFTVEGVTENLQTLDTEQFTEESQDRIVKMLREFKYQIDKETIDGQEAEIDITVTTYDFGAALKAALAAGFTQALSSAFSGGDEKEVETIFEETLNTELSEAKQDAIFKATLELEKTKEGWKLINTADNEALANAISGGILTASKQLQDAFGGDDEATK